jgi:hypothetical protein
MFGWIPLLSTLAQAAPVTTLDTNKPMTTIQPAFIPAGVAFRCHTSTAPRGVQRAADWSTSTAAGPP